MGGMTWKGGKAYQASDGSSSDWIAHLLGFDSLQQSALHVLQMMQLLGCAVVPAGQGGARPHVHVGLEPRIAGTT